ncbi:hypothetical protein GGS23DRAFT_132310 [Durotheca rogersii]|uniref:uncharacterized protein n=1 Tax=Durotheca rogersii TaxID=419775 RepID=UPI00221EEE82|nr:uncharacterized protein GGS23DRAFT_132310 [Durotheca rogersii]KAI5861802.1 hypothetical protein GGS23DRAFT_132310 [Durotheca rogersii]
MRQVSSLTRSYFFFRSLCLLPLLHPSRPCANHQGVPAWWRSACWQQGSGPIPRCRGCRGWRVRVRMVVRRESRRRDLTGRGVEVPAGMGHPTLETAAACRQGR